MQATRHKMFPTIRVGKPLFVDPDVFHTPAIENAVDHQGQPFNVGLPTRTVTVVKNDRSSIVLGQFPFDLPHQLLSLLLVRLARLPTDQLLYLGITVVVPVELRTASVKQWQGLVRVTGTLQVEADT